MASGPFRATPAERSSTQHCSTHMGLSCTANRTPSSHPYRTSIHVVRLQVGPARQAAQPAAACLQRQQRVASQRVHKQAAHPRFGAAARLQLHHCRPGCMGRAGVRFMLGDRRSLVRSTACPDGRQEQQA